ncbi:MAG: alcohol dehydrogenase catalytic domain-containing protein, partial [Nitrospinota bacterium]|nr:alcohol dehydrogenase catalytic domain-containing protein [Nitrospinota bacterium]
MKAILCTKYGAPEVLQLKEVDKPIPNGNEMLLKVYATTVAIGDTRARSFNVPPLFWLAGRIALGFTKPRRPILGMELAGEVEAVGKEVTRFKVGDQVFGLTGHNFGAYAEYCLMSDDEDVVLKPTSMTYEQAAAVP